VKYSIEIGSAGMKCKYIPSFIKIDSGTEEIRLLRNILRGCSVGVADGRDL
jgi:hypothetical protein